MLSWCFRRWNKHLIAWHFSESQKFDKPSGLYYSFYAVTEQQFAVLHRSLFPCTEWNYKHLCSCIALSFHVSASTHSSLNKFFSLVFQILNAAIPPQLIHMNKLISPPGFDALGDLLKPTVTAHTAPPPPPQMAIHPGGKLLANDLDSSLANLVGSECWHTQAS